MPKVVLHSNLRCLLTIKLFSQNEKGIKISTIYQDAIKPAIIRRCGESMDESQSSGEEGNDADQLTDEESKDEPQSSDEKPKDEMKSAVGITQKTGVTGVTKTMKKNMASTKGTGTGGTQNTMKAENAAPSKVATVATNIPKGIYEKLLRLEPISFPIFYYLLYFILILICSN